MKSTFLNIAVSEWKMKLWLFALLATVYCSAYLLIERHLWREPFQVQGMAIDRWVDFAPGWIWVYQSIYLMLPLFLLATTRDALRRMALGMIIIMAIGFTCFVLIPLRGPRLEAAPTTGMYGALIRIDRPFNNLPSLHMAVATYLSCVGIQLTRGRLRRTLMIVMPIWTLLIGYSTLATKQHYFIDLPPGVLLGFLAQRIAWWRAST